MYTTPKPNAAERNAMARFDAVPIGNLYTSRDEHRNEVASLKEELADLQERIRFHQAEADVRDDEINRRLFNHAE